MTSVVSEKRVAISCQDNDVATVSLWLSQGKVVNSVLDGRGNTALHICASSGALECMELLLHQGADVNRTRNDGFWTPLHEALFNNNVGAAVLLMQAGASLAKLSKGGATHPTPLDVATERCNAFQQSFQDPTRALACQPSCVAASAVFTFGKDNHQLGYATRGHAGVQSKPKVLTSLPPRVCITALAASKQHCIAVTNEGEVLSWGCGEFGVLGHGTEANVLFPQRVTALRRKEIIAVAVSQQHSAAVSADGSLYTWGSNAYGQLGAETDDESIEGASGHPFRPRPKRQDFLSSLHVSHVSVGSHHTVAVTCDGIVYGIGDNSRGQLGQKDGQTQYCSPVLFLTSVWSVSSEHRKIVASACGSQHTLLLSGSGTVWMVGNGKDVVKLRFQSESLQDASREGGDDLWRLVKASGTAPIRSISSNHDACGAVDVFGNVWTWSCDDKPPVTVPLPRRVSADGVEHTAVTIAVAPQRVVVTMSDGNVFTWGVSDCGALGLGKSVRKAKHPCRIPTVKHVETVAVSDTHTVLCCSVLYPALPFPENAQAPSACRKSAPKFDEGEEDSVEPVVTDHVKPLEPPSLFSLCEKALVKLVALENAHTLLSYAEMLNAKILAQYCVDTVMLNLDLLLAISVESRQCFEEDVEAGSTSLDKLLAEWQLAFRRVSRGELSLDAVEGPFGCAEPEAATANTASNTAVVKRFKQLRRTFLQATELAVQASLDSTSLSPQQKSLVKQRGHLFRQLSSCAVELEACEVTSEVQRCFEQYKQIVACGCSVESLSVEGTDVVGSRLVAHPVGSPVLAPTTPILTAGVPAILSPETPPEPPKPSPGMKPQAFRDIMSAQASVRTSGRPRTSSVSDKPPPSSGIVTPLKDMIAKQQIESGKSGKSSRGESPKVGWSSSPVQPEAQLLSPAIRTIDFRQLQAEERQRSAVDKCLEGPKPVVAAATVTSPWGFKASPPPVSKLSSIQAAEAERLAREEAERFSKEEDDRLLAYVMALSASEHDAGSSKPRKTPRGSSKSSGKKQQLQQQGGYYRGTWIPPKKE